MGPPIGPPMDPPMGPIIGPSMGPGPDQQLVILRAIYGRMRINRCVSENFGYIGCGDEV